MSSDTTWTAKRERQYKHVVEAEKERGRTEKRAHEIAAAVVNKTTAQPAQKKTGS